MAGRVELKSRCSGLRLVLRQGSPAGVGAANGVGAVVGSLLRVSAPPPMPMNSLLIKELMAGRKVRALERRRLDQSQM